MTYYKYNGDLKQLFVDLEQILIAGDVKYIITFNRITFNKISFVLSDDNKEGILILPEVILPEDLVIRIYEEGLEIPSAANYTIKNDFPHHNFIKYEIIDKLSSYHFIIYYIIPFNVVSSISNKLNIIFDPIDFTSLIRELRLKTINI